jgi:hypothetical protein
MRHALATALACALMILAVGCGGSSKPAFCSNVSNLEQSAKNLDPSKGVSSLKTQLQDLANQAQKIVPSAKSDFPNETAAIDSSVSKLKTDVKSIASSPSPQQIAAVASDAKGLVDAVNNFVSASKSKCQ